MPMSCRVAKCRQGVYPHGDEVRRTWFDEQCMAPSNSPSRPVALHPQQDRDLLVGTKPSGEGCLSVSHQKHRPTTADVAVAHAAVGPPSAISSGATRSLLDAD